MKPEVLLNLVFKWIKWSILKFYISLKNIFSVPFHLKKDTWALKYYFKRQSTRHMNYI